jgi:hypothetical protein
MSLASDIGRVVRRMIGGAATSKSREQVEASTGGERVANGDAPEPSQNSTLGRDAARSHEFPPGVCPSQSACAGRKF